MYNQRAFAHIVAVITIAIIAMTTVAAMFYFKSVADKVNINSLTSNTNMVINEYTYRETTDMDNPLCSKVEIYVKESGDSIAMIHLCEDNIKSFSQSTQSVSFITGCGRNFVYTIQGGNLGVYGENEGCRGIGHLLVISDEVTVADAEKAGWMLLNNTEYGYSFEYPKDYKAVVTTPIQVTFDGSNNSIGVQVINEVFDPSGSKYSNYVTIEQGIKIGSKEGYRFGKGDATVISWVYRVPIRDETLSVSFGSAGGADRLTDDQVLIDNILSTFKFTE